MTTRTRSLPLILSLSACSILSAAFVYARILLSGNITFVFLLWNIILAWVPFLCALILTHFQAQQKKWTVRTWIVAALWLVFYPNAPYIITDFLHLHQRPGIPLWYDVFLIVSCAWTGIMLGCISLFFVQESVEQYFGKRVGWLLVIVMNMISGFGVYLGRFSRFNSWDLFIHPQLVATDILSRVIDPLSHPRTLGVSLTLGSFLVVSYLVVYCLMTLPPGSNHSSHKKTSIS